MKNARTVVENIKEEDNINHSNQFLYRWIDGDAKEDTTSRIPLGVLQDMAASDDKQIITGRYEWRHEETATMDKKMYHQWIELLNEAEKELRDYYYELVERSAERVKEKVRQLQPCDNPRPNGHASQLLHEQTRFPIKYETSLEKPYTENYLPGYYLPETTMLMNETAHDMVEVIESGEQSQDQESMKIMERIFIDIGGGEALPTGSVVYRPELSVKKPLKHEFVEGSYLGKVMRDFLKAGKGDERGFIVALKNIRQSAWGDQWYFVSDAKWNQWETPRVPEKNDDMANRQELFNNKRRLLKDWLWFGFLKDNKDNIRRELV